MSELIRRQDAINLLKKWSDGYSYIEIETELAIKEFQHLPSAQPESKRGRWKIIDDTEFRVPGWYCSLCNYQISDRYGKYNYCPNCGALMEE